VGHPDRASRPIRCANLRQKALEQPDRRPSAAAYDAIASMLAPLGDPYTRLCGRSRFPGAALSTEAATQAALAVQLGLSPDGGGGSLANTQ